MGSSTASGLRVLVITGQSGAGKGTLIGALLERFPELELAVSATTRARRPSEQDGRDYRFISEDEFERLIAADDFLEHVVYVSGHRYGTLRSELDRIAGEGRLPVLELELDGALAVRDKVPGSVTVFITAPLPELERRLRARATESSGEIDERIELAGRQLEHAGEFDHLVVNDDLRRAGEELAGIVQRELEVAGTMSRP